MLTVSPWHHIVKPLWVAIESVDHCAHVTRVTVLLVVFFLRVLTSEGGSVCLGVAILCTVMCFFGVHNELSKPFVLFCFFLSPPPPLSYCSPPTGCAFVTFATRAMAQNAIKTMHHSQTMEVLYPLAPTSHPPPSPSPSYILLPPCAGKMKKLSKQMAFIHQTMSHFQKPLLLITKLHCRLQNNWIKLEAMPRT